jgi:chromosomal replication initiator protein
MEKSVEEIVTQFKADMKQVIGYDIDVWYNVVEHNIVGDLFVILSNVSQCCMITLEQLRSKTRKREIVEARQIYCKLAKKRTKYTLEQIGSAINKDHATVLHSVRTCNNLIETNINFKNKYNDCKNI